MRRHALLLFGSLMATTTWGAPSGPGFHAQVKVTRPTRLDWTFVVASQSLTEVPRDWLGKFDSSAQTYDLFVPERKERKTPLPLLLYLSPGNEGSWKQFEKLARSQGMLYVAPRNAGNDVPPRRRVRMVLDVLDEVLRDFPVDPDRTYIAGFSGGGRIACAIAFALPELFGGVIPLCATGDLRQEPWLRQRVADRLSVALVTGENDFNRGEVERLRGPFLAEVGVRSRVWMVAGLGHALPGERTLMEVFRWLEEGLPRRRKLASAWPASRFSTAERASQARLLLAEGKKRMESASSRYAGLMQVQGTMKRWPDLAEGKAAQKLLEEFESGGDTAWEKEDVAEQRRFLVAQARALDRYATGPLDPRYRDMKAGMLREAVRLYKTIAEDGPDTTAGREARKRLPVLEKLLDGE
ncbi:MAG: hypothetical protein U0840_26950 [Gemmataceae bacterium]